MANTPCDSTSKVLEAASLVFCECGFNASIDMVAQRAGVARQTIYNHFGNKETLFANTMEYAVKSLFSSVDLHEGSWREQLFRLSAVFRSEALKPEHIRAHRVLVAEVPRFPELAQHFYEKVILFSRQFLVQIIEPAMRQGQLRQDNPQEAAQAYMALLISDDYDRMIFGGSPPPAEKETQKIERTLELFERLYGIPASNSSSI